MNYFLYKINVKWPCILNAHDPFFFKGPSEDEDKEKEQSASEQAQKAQVKHQIILKMMNFN